MRRYLSWALLGLLLVTPLLAIVPASNVQEERISAQNLTSTIATNVFTSFFGGSGEEYPHDGKVDSQGDIILAGETGSPDFPVLNAFSENYSGNTDGFLTMFSSDYSLIFSTYFGGSDLDLVSDICLDSNDNIIVLGMTQSEDFPLLNPLQSAYGGGERDGFIAKFNSTGGLLFSTYFGGSGWELLLRVVCDENNDILITGTTSSPNLRTTEGVLQPEFGGDSDIMIIKLDSDGQSLHFCTYFGTADAEFGEGIRFDPSGNIVVVGTADSAACVSQGAYQQEYGGGPLDVVLLRLDASAKTLSFATLLGGNDWEICSEIQFDADDNIILGGVTASDDFPILDGIQEELAGPMDSFFSIMNNNGSLLYSTYIGGNGVDENYGGEPLDDGSLILSGRTGSTDYPVTNPLKNGSQGISDAFVLHMEPNGKTIRFSTLFGGSNRESCEWCGVDSEGNYILIGYTTSRDLPIANAYQPEYAGAQDAFVTVVSVTTTSKTTTTTNLFPEFEPLLTILGLCVVAVIVVVAAISIRRRS
jgi:hypothetical protein